MVGTQRNFSDTLKALVELDFDAVEACEAAINRLDNIVYKQKLEEFRQDPIKTHTRINSATVRA